MNDAAKSRRKMKSSGFTLLELIVVITIIGILASLVVVRTSGFTYNARKTAALAEMQNIVKVAEGIHTETGRYPETIEEMLEDTDANGRRLSVNLNEYPRDPWSNEYVYEIYDGQPQVTCYGADGEPGGEEDNEDIYYPAQDEEY